jgi:hypothetical protein
LTPSYIGNGKNYNKYVVFLQTEIIQRNSMGKTTSNLDEFEDNKGVTRICKSKDRQHNGQKKKDK